MKSIWISFICTLAALGCSRIAGAQEGKPAKALPVPGEVFQVSGHTAFLIPAPTRPDKSAPWVWYAPTLPNLPGKEEKWMFDRFLKRGISIAGIDVGESYGNPAGRKLFTDMYQEMTGKRGFSPKPVLLGRSRGGLMTLAWAVENPEKVGGFAGIYPVCNISSYPGLTKAAGAYGLTETGMRENLAEHNPVDRLEKLAKAKVPLFAIHGDVDTVVPLEVNSDLLRRNYAKWGGPMELIVPKGQGHNMWAGFFESEEFVRFVQTHAR